MCPKGNNKLTYFHPELDSGTPNNKLTTQIISNKTYITITNKTYITL